MGPPSMSAPLNLRSLTSILFRRKKAFLSFFLAVALAASAYLLIAQRKYQSEALVLFNFSSKDLADSSMNSGEQHQVGTTDVSKIVNSEMSLLQSDDLVRATLMKVGLPKVYPAIYEDPPSYGTPLDAAVEQFGKDLDVSVQPNTNVLQVTLLNPDPAIAQQTLATLLAVFMERQASMNRNPRTAFLQAQLDEAHRAVDAAQHDFLAYKQQHGISSLEDERPLLLRQRGDIEENLGAAQSKMADSQKRRDDLRKALGLTPAEITLTDENDNGVRELADAKDRLSAAESRYQIAKQTYAPGNPVLADERANLDLARKNYNDLDAKSRSRLRTGANPVRQTLQTNLTGVEADVAAGQAVLNQLNGQLVAINARLDSINSAEGQLLDLKGKLDVATQNYQAYLQRTVDARVAEDLNREAITSVGLAQDPSLPYKPARPKVLLVLALALLTGVIGAAGLCFILEMVDETVSRPEQVEPLVGLPVLVTLSHANLRRMRG